MITACGGGSDSADVPDGMSASSPLDADEIALARVAAESARPDTNWQPPSGSTPRNINYVYLQSDAADYIGAGRTYLYTQANAFLTFVLNGPHVGIEVRGDEHWFGDFQELARFTVLKRGLFTGAVRWPFQTETQPGLNWSGEGRGCNTVNGWFAVDELEFERGVLQLIVLRFAQYCEGGTAALRGKIRWSPKDRTAPPPPVYPPPANLWQPAAGSTPATGSYVYLQGDRGEYLLDNQARTYTLANALMAVTPADGGATRITVGGDESWSGTFKAMDTLAQLRPGYYPDLRAWPFYNPAKGGISWSGNGRDCSTAITGWFVVDAIQVVDGNVTALDLRFEQHCGGALAALRGKIHWDGSEPVPVPPPPVYPPPADLWQPAPGSTPTAGNYVYLQSDPGDPTGQGNTFTYTAANAQFFFSGSALNQLSVRVESDRRWFGSFEAMYSLPQLQPGYYGDLRKWPLHNRVKGGLDWAGDGAGCAALVGWFVIDSITYTGPNVTAIDLRFEQRCDGGAPALHGKIHWVEGDLTGSGKPIFPPPATLWDAPAGSTPATGNYVYLQSDASDFIGLGRTYLYNDLNTLFTFSTGVGRVSLGLIGDQTWNADFQGMQGLNQLEPGYYPDLKRYFVHDPLKGGLLWFGEGRFCASLTGWFVVDSIVYNGADVAAIDLRFEQHCDGATEALRGKIHWSAAAAQSPPGPIFPTPPKLWRPAAGTTPPSGNYVYLQSDPGDFIGLGQTLTVTPVDGIAVSGSGNGLTVFAGEWNGAFVGMSFLTALQPGYYSDLKRLGVNNPVKGGMFWFGQGRTCNTLIGWFVVDAVQYSGSAITAIDLRFEQRCEGAKPTLHGQVHWVAGQ